MSTTSTIGTAARTYSTITAWHAAFTAGGWIGACYNDSLFSEHPSIGGTSGTNFEFLSPAAGQSALDSSSNALTFNQGNGVALDYNVAAGTTLTVGNFCTVERMQIRYSGAGTTGKTIAITGAATIDRNILVNSDTGVGTGAYVINGPSFSANGSITNNVLIAYKSNGIGFVYTYGGLLLANNTIVAPSDQANTNKAINSALYESGNTFINNAFFGFSGALTYTGTVTAASNNATDAATLPSGWGTLTAKTYANQFTGITTTGGLDYRVKSGADLINAGTTGSGIPTIDIFGTARSGTTPTIGAFEFASGGGGVNINMAGVAATGAVGSFGPSALLALGSGTATGHAAAFVDTNLPALAGVAATGAVGVLGSQDTVGLGSATTTGTVVAFGKQDSTGLSSVTAAGAVAPFGITMNPAFTAVAAIGVAEPFSVSGNVNLNLGGVAAVGAVVAFTFQGSDSHALTGVSVSGTAEPFGIVGNASLTGVQCIGTAAPFVKQDSIGLVGVATVGMAEPFTPSGTSNLSLTGVQAIGAATPFSAGNNVNQSLTGVAATGHAASFGEALQTVLQGVAATGQAGSFTVVVNTALHSVAAVGVAQPFGANDNLSLGAVAANGAAAAFVEQATVGLTGVQAVGFVVPFNIGGKQLTFTGVAAIGAVAGFEVQITLRIIGCLSSSVESVYNAQPSVDALFLATPTVQRCPC